MSSRYRINTRPVGFLVCVMLFVALGPSSVPVVFAETDSGAASDMRRDIYYQTEGPARGVAAEEMVRPYPRYGFLDNRLIVWLVAQQHTYFGGFVLALPIFALLLELLGVSRRDRQTAMQYDGLARDILRVALLALSCTAVLGTVMLTTFLTLYPGFMGYMGVTFKGMMPFYAAVFVSESFLLAVYYYTWDLMATPARKWVHMAIGVMVNGTGVVLLLFANGWASFMMAPSGVDADGRFLGNIWHLLHSPLWNPLNAHRFLADLMSGGAVVVAYAAYRFLSARTEAERAYFDWVGYVFFVVVVCALLPMPFAGYWLMRAVFEFRQPMGVTMMGGLLSWLFVVQAMTVGVLFLGINYYIWQSMERIAGGARFQPYFKAIVYGLMVCFFVWFTPHTIAMTPSEMKAMGAAQHPVIGQFGVMSAKNGAINVMICLTALSYLLYRRANKIVTVPWARAGDIALGTLFVAGMLNIVWLAVYGFYIPANTRVGLSVPQGATTATVLLVGLLLNRALMKGAETRGPIAWGKISVRGMIALFGVAACFTWVMGLMGYIRSAGRLGWHVNELMADTSPWAYTPSLIFAAKMVTVNMIVFWGAVYCIFWLAGRDLRTVDERVPLRQSQAPLMQTLSREESA